MKFFCKHDWSAWSEMISTYNGARQFRTCTKCNMVKHKKAGCSLDTNLAVWNTDRDDE